MVWDYYQTGLLYASPSKSSRRKRETSDAHNPYIKGRQVQEWATRYDHMYREGLNLQSRINIMTYEKELVKQDCVWRLFDEMDNIKRMLKLEKEKSRSLEAIVKVYENTFKTIRGVTDQNHEGKHKVLK